ncbi:DUF805 domain-containing protein [Aurantiacibacter spongiae]|uniref:DUF805 domain-containing protein n=1 Tax=Aurantiacibacter spongiae TaxID=2488860 RepID=A0A3N5CSI2_9SPHN|nr:DUF805 domain-containing protein [Aurantiacibacter spongiae]RPF72094.1 DUF805 domain-containing protein [Aurantiacibacter spongiae]
MSPFDWMLQPLKRYGQFRGRAQRAEFWWFMLFYYGVSAVLFAIIFAGFPWVEMLGASRDPQSLAPMGLDMNFWLMGTGGVLYALFYIAMFVPYLAVTVRRLHDREMSGWWYGGLLIASFVPFVNMVAWLGFLALIVVCALPGTAGPNRHGPDPKDPHQVEVFA